MKNINFLMISLLTMSFVGMNAMEDIQRQANMIIDELLQQKNMIKATVLSPSGYYKLDANNKQLPYTPTEEERSWANFNGHEVTLTQDGRALRKAWFDFKNPYDEFNKNKDKAMLQEKYDVRNNFMRGAAVSAVMFATGLYVNKK